MKEEAEELGRNLKDKYGDKVDFVYVDVATDAINGYPRVKQIIDKVKFPLTVINGEPKFHGGLALYKINEAIKEILGS